MYTHKNIYYIYMKKINNNFVIFILVIVLLVFLNYDNIVDFFLFKEGLTKKEKDQKAKERQGQLGKLKNKIIGDYKGNKGEMSKDEFINLLSEDKCRLIKEYIDILILIVQEDEKT